MTSFDLTTVQTALSLLENKHALPISNIPKSLQEFAKLATPKRLDSADIFVLLSKPDQIAETNREEIQTLLREHMGFDASDPDGVTLSFSVSRSESGGVLAKTKIRPDNIDETKAPIVFVGGLYHKTSLYLDALVQLARLTEREVLAYDTPGVGASNISENSVRYRTLADSMREVIRSEYPDKKVIVMGHSVGSIPVRDLYLNPGEFNDQIEKYIMVAPIPATDEQRHGLRMSFKFMLSGAWSLISHGGKMAPTVANGENFFFPEREESERAQLEGSMENERFPVGPLKFLSILRKIYLRSIYEKIGQDDQLGVILAGNDKLMICNDENAWREKGATIIEGADHSFLAGKNIPQPFIDPIVEMIEKSQ